MLFARLKMAFVSWFGNGTTISTFSIFQAAFPLSGVFIAINELLDSKSIFLSLTELPFITITILINLDSVSLFGIVGPLSNVDWMILFGHFTKAVFKSFSNFYFELANVVRLFLVRVWLENGFWW